MTEATRRSFLQTSLLAAVGGAGAARASAQGGGAAPSILERTGVALYTVR